MRLTPFLPCFSYGIQQSDKTGLSTMALFGLREDTGLVGQQYSWLTTIFYICYLAFEFPCVPRRAAHLSPRLTLTPFRCRTLQVQLCSPARQYG